MAPYQRPPLIPAEDEPEKTEEGFFSSIGRLVLNSGSSVAEIFGGLISGFKRKPRQYQFQHQYQQATIHSRRWPMQESFVIPDEDEPPSLDIRTPTLKRSYPFMTKELERKHHIKQSRPHYSSNPQTYYEENCETNEIVFGAVQEQDGRREAVVSKAVDYGDTVYNHHNLRPRLNYMGTPMAY